MIVPIDASSANIVLNRAADTGIKVSGDQDLTGYAIKFAIQFGATLTFAPDTLDPKTFFMTFTAETAQALGDDQVPFQIQFTSPAGRRSVPMTGYVSATGFVVA